MADRAKWRKHNNKTSLQMVRGRRLLFAFFYMDSFLFDVIILGAIVWLFFRINTEVY
jgi:hypothetical protein